MASIETRRTESGELSFHAKVRLKGYPPQYASFRRLTDARRWIQSTEAAIREGRHFKSSESKKHTLADAIERYTKEVLPQKAKGGANQTAQLAWWKLKLGKLALADVTSAAISEHRNMLLQEPKAPKSKKPKSDDLPRLRSPATVVRYLAALSHVFTISTKEWGWTEDNPVSRVKMPRQSRGRVRFLSDSEREALLTACKERSDVLYLVVVLAISTGMRRGEIMNMTWRQVDFERQAIMLTKTKNGQRRRVSLTGLALHLLAAYGQVRRIDSDLVFPGNSGNKPVELKRPWLDALSKAEIDDFRFHDLRHSTASYLAMNGATLVEIADVLGHRTLDMVRRYTHIAESHSMKVVTSMTAKIFGKEAA